MEACSITLHMLETHRCMTAGGCRPSNGQNMIGFIFNVFMRFAPLTTFNSFPLGSLST